MAYGEAKSNTTASMTTIGQFASPRGHFLSLDQIRLGMDIFNVIVITVNIGGVLTNTFNIIVFKRMGLRDSVTLCLFVQSVVDLIYVFYGLLQSICILTLAIINNYLRLDTGIVVPETIVSNALSSFGFTLYDISIFNTAYITVQRCCCVARPLHFKHFFTVRKSAIVVFAVVVYVLATKMPELIADGLIAVELPGTNKSIVVVFVRKGIEQVRQYMAFLNTIVIPVCLYIIVFICYVILAKNLRKSAKFRQSSTMTGKNVQESSSKVDKSTQVEKTVLFMSVLYLITNLPRTTFALLYESVPSFYLGNYYYSLVLVLFGCSFIMEYLNASLNILIYYTCNSKYRQTFREMFGAKAICNTQ